MKLNNLKERITTEMKRTTPDSLNNVSVTLLFLK